MKEVDFLVDLKYKVNRCTSDELYGLVHSALVSRLRYLEGDKK